MLCSAGAWASDPVNVEIGGIYYDLNPVNQTAAVAKWVSDRYSGDVVIPKTVVYDDVTYTVTSIGNEAFQICMGLSSITIPETVKSIGNYAFQYCTGLTSVSIPESVTAIGESAFSSCSKLATVNIPSGVTTIGNSTFYECTLLTSIVIPEGVTTIGNDAFNECGLTSVVIPNSVTSIGSYAFSRCKLTSVTIGTGVTSIGDYAFYDCNYLTSVTIPNNVTSIGEKAFAFCDILASVTIGTGVTSIGEKAFYESLINSMTIYRKTLPDISSDAIPFYSFFKLYVFNDCVATYEAVWPEHPEYKDQIDPITLTVNESGVTGLGSLCSYYNGMADVTVPEGTTIYKAALNDDKTQVVLTEVSGNIIPKGQAVLLKSDAAVVLSSAADGGSGDFTGNNLHGVDVSTARETVLSNLGAASLFTMSMQGGNFGFFKYTGANVPANKAFLALDDSDAAAARGLSMVVDGETTAIEGLAPVPSSVEDESGRWYTLDGRSLNGRPTTKGVYIKNGNKVVIK